jgi:hypothetical protein
MSPQWKRLDRPPAPALGPVYLDAVLQPNRSLSRAAFGLLIGGFALLNILVGAGFILAGAYPVAGFMGLDVVLLAGAFYWNYRSGRARERVLVAADRLHVWREPVRGGADHWIVHPQWVRLETADKALVLAAGGRSLAVAECLSPQEREDFAEALSGALRRARGAR